MALKVMKTCRTCALLTRLKFTPEIGWARLAALKLVDGDRVMAKDYFIL